VNSLGFYSLNGKSIYHDTKTAKKKDIARFLRAIRHENPLGTIVLVWDNARVHMSKLARRTVRRLDIVLVFLPPYSPDLNPIEFIWKSIKKKLSSKCLMTKEAVRDVVEEMLYKFSSSLSFTKAWIQKFLEPLHVSLQPTFNSI
jgi:putative transposase